MVVNFILDRQINIFDKNQIYKLKAESPNLLAKDNRGKATEHLSNNVGEHVFPGESLGKGHHNRNGRIKMATRNFAANENGNVKR